jgi:hypothetical protein
LAQDVIQDGAKNLLDNGVLRSQIDTSKSSVNFVDGQLIKVEKRNLSFLEALKASLEKIPHGRYSLIFIDDRDVTGDVLDEIKNSYHSRKEPQIFTGSEATSDLKKWLCQPQKRENDFCIVGTQHQCNGIETDIVAHIYPDDCPWCGISYADPVVISRAMAMLIVTTYKRVRCGCGLSLCNEEANEGWITPEHLSDDEDNSELAVLNPSVRFQRMTTQHSSIRYLRQYFKKYICLFICFVFQTLLHTSN